MPRRSRTGGSAFSGHQAYRCRSEPQIQQAGGSCPCRSSVHAPSPRYIKGSRHVPLPSPFLSPPRLSHLSHLRCCCCCGVATPPLLHQRPIPASEKAPSAVVVVHPGSAVLRPLGPIPPCSCSGIEAAVSSPFRTTTDPGSVAVGSDSSSHEPAATTRRCCTPRLMPPSLPQPSRIVLGSSSRCPCRRSVAWL